MDVERARSYLLTLPHVVETMQWGDNLVFWVGDKAIGGKMFALMNLEADGRGVISYPAGPERFSELLEQKSFLPAPYFARIHWVTVERWDAIRDTEWQSELRAAHAIVFDKLPKKTLTVLAMPERERKKLIDERRRLLVAKSK